MSNVYLTFQMHIPFQLVMSLASQTVLFTSVDKYINYFWSDLSARGSREGTRREYYIMDLHERNILAENIIVLINRLNTDKHAI